jgi:hypothetical protein
LASVVTAERQCIDGYYKFNGCFLSCGMTWAPPWLPLGNSDKRSAISRERLESAIAEAVKSESDGFVGVVVQRIQPKSRTDPDWAVRGIQFGKADRDKSSEVLAGVVERMQREFSLSDDEEEGTKSQPQTVKIRS